MYMEQVCYDTDMPFGLFETSVSISIVSSTSKSFAEGTGAEAAAPAAVCSC
jgi:hypothetical protein